jgi:hypothetical protein
MPSQLQFWPRKALIEYPPAVQTADSLGMAEADDGALYYIKTDDRGRPTRASEWLGTHIAEAVGIQAPSAVVVERLNGELVFGSRRVIGVSDEIATRSYLLTPSVSNTAVPISGLTGILSRIYALDMFLGNVDRHFGNYLSIDDSGVRRLYAFDFSRAVFWEWPWSAYPTIQSNTRMHGRILRQLHGFDTAAAAAVLDNIAGLAPNTIEGFFNLMPADWCTDQLRAQFIGMWTAGHCSNRVASLRQGFNDGTLL